MTKKSGRVLESKIPPPYPKELKPYSNPYSLGDVEYLAYLRNIAGDSKKTELAIDDIERETRGDFGKVIKEITEEGQLPEKYLKGYSKKKFYGTTRRGAFYPKQEGIDRTILVNRTDYRDKFGAKYDKRDIDSRSFFEKLKGIFGYGRDDFNLKEEIEKGTSPTKEAMELLQQHQGAETTTRHELDHYFFDLMRRLGYKFPDKDLADPKKDYEEAFVTDTDRVLPKEKFGEGKNPKYYLPEYYNKINKLLEEMADKELKKRRGYKEGGLLEMMKTKK